MVIGKYSSVRSFGEKSLLPLFRVGTVVTGSVAAATAEENSWLEEPVW